MSMRMEKYRFNRNYSIDYSFFNLFYYFYKGVVLLDENGERYVNDKYGKRVYLKLNENG